MTNETAYRLGDYRIAVIDEVLIRWEHHVPLGMARSGRCFLYGDVLIIGEKSRDEDGYLIGEFHDALRKLQPWTRTSYYCFAGELHDPGTGQSLTDEVLENYSFTRNRPATETDAIKGPGDYRLGHYHIAIASDGRISWTAYGDVKRIFNGSCSITSGILVVGPREREGPGEGKKEFLDVLNSLPRWDRTRVWCRGDALRACSQTQIEKDPGIFGRLCNVWHDDAVHEQLLQPEKRPAPARKNRQKPARNSQFVEKSNRFLLSSLNAVESAWRRMRTGTAWMKWFLVVIAVMLLLGAAAAIYEENEFFWIHHKRHHDHHDHDDNHGH